MLPAGVAFSQVPPESVTLAESAPPTLITLMNLCAGLAPPVT